MSLKKVIGAVIVLTMTMHGAAAITGFADSDPEPVLWYNFEDGAKDASGNNNNGTVYGATIEGNSAVFDGTDDYIRMPDGLLKDASSATVAIYLKSEIEKANQFTWCIGNSNEAGYMFLNTYNPNSKLRAAITLTDYKAESELAASNYVQANEWTSIIAVFDGANSTLYRDGKAVATANISIKPSDLGATTANYIAKSVYNDPYFKGTVSDFRIYDKALTAEEAKQLSEKQKNSYAKTAPKITAVSGDGIKSYGVEIDSANKTIFVPVPVGYDMTQLSLSFTTEREATVTLKSGTYADGVITVTDAEDASLTSDWTVNAGERGNAVLDGYYADPNIAVFDGRYYIYPTTDGGSGWDAPYFKCFSSDDLVNWKDEGVILDLRDVSWSNGKNGWAPTITEKNGKYYFYYSAASAAGDTKNLAVAVADTPMGPFVDKGIIAEGGSLPKGQMIDSAVFTDDDGQSYLYWGNGALYGAKLSEDMLKIDGDIKTLTPSNFREAAFMIKRNGVYYMMWSDDDTGNPNYNVRYGTMKEPLGSITGNNQILHRSNAESDLIKGTGHHSVINIPGTDDWYICYHRFNTSLYGHQESQSSAAGNHREVCIDKMEFDANGNINKVTPTLEGITEPVYASKSLVNISQAKKNGEKLSWALSATGDISDVDIYTALYDSDNTLMYVVKNQMNGEFQVDPYSEYLMKVLIWKKDTIEPTDGGYLKKQIKSDISMEEIEAMAEELTPDKEIRGNQYMPSEYNGVTITWTTDNDAVKPDGTVTRGKEEDIEVNIKAVYSIGAYSFEKEYQSTVIAAASEKTEEDMDAYLFVHFVGSEGTAESEQIYFSVSKDGQNWTTLNDHKPVLTSVLREKGVRDPHIIRSPEGDKFFLIATDLSIYNRRGDSNRWGTCQTAGSRYIMIWESTDLVNWSEQRMAKVAVPNAGCAWAPESVYDYEKGQYMVFWASKVSDDNYSTQRIYRCYTSDFEHFTEPEVYIGENVSNIDTTFITHEGVYYRFTKNESKSTVTMMQSAALDGPWEKVPTYTLDDMTGYEGPTIYKLNGENKWCLLLDYYSATKGYKPFVTDDITKGTFTAAADFNFDTTYRHGTVMPITSDEYKALTAAYTKADISGLSKVVKGETAQYSVTVLGEKVSAEWSVSDSAVAEIDDTGLLTAKQEGTVTVTAYLPDYSKEISKKVTVVDEIKDIDKGLVMNITFDEEDTGKGEFEATDGGTVTEKGTVKYADGKHGNALSLEWGTGNYLELPDGILSGAKEAAVSFWVKQGVYSAKDSWPFMTTPVSSAVYKSEKYIGVLLSKDQKTITLERYFSNSQERPTNASASGSFGDWNYVTVNIGENSSTIYVNGKKVAEQPSTVDLSNLFTAGAKSWIGHANWNDGEGLVGMMDDFRLYGRTLSEDEITTLMGE
ncbi:MAG: family 43 glycosylhydrolase [Oscillospiraceae bacterium]|nr:family 43 glycosylhydrolase [Oscillospiraceae bacterium]